MKIVRTGLARSKDPVTSHTAAEEVNGELTERHLIAVGWLRVNAPATDDHVATAMVDLGVVDKHEKARRLVRTCREKYGLIVPFLDDDGQQLQMQNESGRMALAWKVHEGG